MQEEIKNAVDECYVLRSEVIEFLRSFYREEDDKHDWRDHTNDCIDRILSKINNEISSADVAPILHARWVKKKEDALVHWDCSACGIAFLDDSGLDKYYYCPHCGAKMDGGTENAVN